MFSWLGKVSQLRREYSWLLFFSVPKLLLLHSLVDELQPDLAAIVSEISFLFENDSDVREKLTNVLKVKSINFLFHHFLVFLLALFRERLLLAEAHQVLGLIRQPL